MPNPTYHEPYSALPSLISPRRLLLPLLHPPRYPPLFPLLPFADETYFPNPAAAPPPAECEQIILPPWLTGEQTIRARGVDIQRKTKLDLDAWPASSLLAGLMGRAVYGFEWERFGLVDGWFDIEIEIEIAADSSADLLRRQSCTVLQLSRLHWWKSWGVF